MLPCNVSARNSICNPDKLIVKFRKFVLKLLVLVLFFQVNPSVIVMFAMTQRYPVRMSDSLLLAHQLFFIFSSPF